MVNDEITRKINEAENRLARMKPIWTDPHKPENRLYQGRDGLYLIRHVDQGKVAYLGIHPQTGRMADLVYTDVDMGDVQAAAGVFASASMTRMEHLVREWGRKNKIR